MSLAGLSSWTLRRPQGGRCLVRHRSSSAPSRALRWPALPGARRPGGTCPRESSPEPSGWRLNWWTSPPAAPASSGRSWSLKGILIHPGEILARLDRVGLDASLARARAEVARMETAHRQLELPVHPQEERQEGVSTRLGVGASVGQRWSWACGRADEGPPAAACRRWRSASGRPTPRWIGSGSWPTPPPSPRRSRAWSTAASPVRATSWRPEARP